MENEKQKSFLRFDLKVYYCKCGKTNYATDIKPEGVKCMFCNGSVENEKNPSVKRKN